MRRKFKVGILGATGMVGQRFIALLEDHPQMEVVLVAASKVSAGKTYMEAVSGRLKLGKQIPHRVMGMVVHDLNEVEAVASQVDFVFCAVDMDKERIRKIEDAYAKTETVVISNNSAHRWTPDVPMIIPEINPEHLNLVHTQRKRLGTSRGCVVVKPNCSLQSFLPPLYVLLPYLRLDQVIVTTYQAVSGAGKTLADWPDMSDNVIPYIPGEEAKTSTEPRKILGRIDRKGDEIVMSEYFELPIRSNCLRVAVNDGHLAVVDVLTNGPSISAEERIKLWRDFNPLPQRLGLYSAPKPCIIYDEKEGRPQPRLDRDNGKGMAFTVGSQASFKNGFRFIALSHNTIRGAAGGAILTAELMIAQKYIEQK